MSHKLSLKNGSSWVICLNFSLFSSIAVCGAKPGHCHTAEIVLNDIFLPVSQGGEDIILWAFQAIIQQHFNTKDIIKWPIHTCPPQGTPVLLLVWATPSLYQVPWMCTRVTGRKKIGQRDTFSIKIMMCIIKMCSQNLQTFVLLLLALSPTCFSLPFMWLWHPREAFMCLLIITVRLSTFKDFKDSRWTAEFWHLGPGLNEGLCFLEAQLIAGTTNCCSVHIWAPQSSQKSRQFSGLKLSCVVSTRQLFADALWAGLFWVFASVTSLYQRNKSLGCFLPLKPWVIFNTGHPRMFWAVEILLCLDLFSSWTLK